ncbi:MAG: hypothetical protein KBS41_05100 [Oscillospiraceae bacterium]|nr:hypothetical protein [Candidatus Equicaccousia limihippi]
MENRITADNYNEFRDEIKQHNSNLLGVVLNPDEERLNQKLEQLKKDYKAGCGGAVPYDIPVLTDQNLTNSPLYRFCKAMPKGADLHVHDLALLPLPQLIDLLLCRPEFFINTDRTALDLVRVEDGKLPPDGYIRFCDAFKCGVITYDELVNSWTLLGARQNGMGVWEYFEELFVKHACLSNNDDFAIAYYKKAFQYYYDSGIMHVEIHLLTCDDLDECARYVKTVRAVYYDFKKEHPDFYLKIIGAGMKDDNDRLETTKKCFLNTVYTQENIKDDFDKDDICDLVIGFDLINEEDASLPLCEFAPMLLKVKKNYPSMRLFIHGGESLDAANDNLIDAYLLGVSRVGHGLNLYRYPDLLDRYAKSEICLEVCPISNQSLGYTVDIRNHPAAEYLRRGVAIALCSDDPTYQENETLTDDFFAAVVGWDLNLADLKQLAINSITYSGLSKKQKRNLLRAYNQRWNEFVKEML